MVRVGQIIFGIAFLLSCRDQAEATHGQNNSAADSKNEVKTKPRSYPYSMLCNPLRFSRDQTVNVLLPQPHGRAMVINTPDNRSLYISWESADAPEGHGPPIRGAVFESMTQISLNTESEGYDPERYVLDKVFRKPGNYEVIVGEWLDSDEAPWQGYCRVQYGDR